MKILHLLSSNKFSGAENVACQIIKAFSGDESVQMAYCSPDGPIAQTLKEKGIAFYPLRKLCKKELNRVICQFKPDVIHSHDMKASFISAISKKGIKKVSHIHNSDFSARKISIKSLVYNYSCKRFSKIIWVSDSCFDTYRFKQKVKDKSIILQNVIDVNDLYEKVNADQNQYEYDIVYVGRFANPKNPLRFVDVIEKVIKVIPNVKVAMIGDGELLEQTKLHAESKKLLNNIKFLGFRSNPYKMLSQAKVLVMTSDREGLPMIAVEAMALEVPIVSTPTDGLCDLIKNGKNGYLSNEDDALAHLIEKILQDEALQKSLKSNCRACAINNLDMDKYRKELFEIYSN